MKRVVITGMGAVTPLGNSVPAYWDRLLAGRSGAGPITRFDASRFKTRFAAEVKDFDPAPLFEKGELRKYDRFTQFAVAAADEALRQSGLDAGSIDRTRAGVILGAGDGGLATFEEQFAAYVTGDGTPRFNPFFIPKRIVNIASGVLSIRYGFQGPSFTTASACAAGNTAIIEAFNQVRWGKADVMLAGGAEASVTPSSIGGFNASKALSTANEDPAAASRPFDRQRDGFVLGEGAGILVLESLEHATARGARILGEVVGGGLASDAYHLTGTHPEGAGAALGMRLALEEGGIAPGEVDYINAHATSTPQGDRSELSAILSVFGATPAVAISATKSMTGHLLGAAGAIEAIACVEALRTGWVPPTINTNEIEEGFAGLNIVTGAAVQKEMRYALSNTFGFGGHIACVLFRKYA
ncbi:beta-ketoacyl-ACP synthase II [Flaviaesturariibacter amylovorans]|uniref:3-oxoacyl-[acyl-carrier-protein] synthase 2 n=1 Tax=Flaviaesturariibacter amylovorans TaxID=1084520 RepID=A0ABP8GCF4_9BACT